MKLTLIIIILVFFVSCVGHNENMSYSNHIQQIDSIVSAGINKDSLETLLAGYKAGRDDVERMVLMRELGRAYRESSDFGKALDYHEEALSLAKELKDTSNIIFILNQLGTDFRRMGALNEAAEKHYEALSYCGKYSDRSSAGAQKQRVVSLNGIGNVHLSLQNYDAAESVFKSALSGEKRLGSHLGQAINYANIGYVKEANGIKIRRGYIMNIPWSKTALQIQNSAYHCVTIISDGFRNRMAITPRHWNHIKILMP